MNPADPPRVLLVEDDPVSAAFLQDALTALPVQVSLATTVAQALQQATRGEPHALYLIDANLPDGRGECLLEAMRKAGLRAPALAHTAADDAAMRERLLATGFEQVLCKPITVGALHAAVRAALEPGGAELPRGGKLPAWDEGAALQAMGGQAAHVATLRALFLQELSGQRARIRAAATAGDQAGVRAELHRLLAGCGFVGASRLLQAVRELQEDPLATPRLQRLDEAVEDLLAT